MSSSAEEDSSYTATTTTAYPNSDSNLYSQFNNEIDNLFVAASITPHHQDHYQRLKKKSSNESKFSKRNYYIENTIHSTASEYANLRRSKTYAILFDEKWRKQQHALSLPLYQVINNRQTAKHLFPHLHENHGKFLNLNASKTLHLLNSTSGNPDLARIVVKQYLTQKKSFQSIEEFIVFKLNELDAITKNGTKIPNSFRTSVVCDLFEALSNTDHYSSPIMDRLKLELYRSIYGQNSEFANEFTIMSQGMDLPPKLMVPSKTFFKLTPFFEQLEVLTSSQNSKQRQLSRRSSVRSHNGSGSLGATHRNRTSHADGVNSQNHQDSSQSNKNQQIATQDKDPNSTNSVLTNAGAKLLALTTARAGNDKHFATELEFLKACFLAWEDVVKVSSQQKVYLKSKIKVSIKKHTFKMRRMHFLAWKDQIYKTKITFYQVNEFKLKRKLEDSQRAALSLLKKNTIAEQQIARVRQLRQASEMDQEQALEKRMLKLELEFIMEKLQHARRKLIQLQSSRDVVYTPLLLNEQEQITHTKLDAMLSEEIVIRWVSYHLKTIAKANPGASTMLDGTLPTKITNFTHDLNDCCVLFLLMHKLRGEEMDLDYKKLSLCFQTSKRKKCVQLCLQEMKEFLDDFDGLITFGDLFQIHSDVIFIFLVTMMQNYPMLALTNTDLKKVFSKIDMRLLKLQSNVIDEITGLQSLVTDSETVLNQANAYIESIHGSHQVWLNAVNKCQKKALQCFAARRFGSSIYIHSDAEARQVHKNPNGLLYFTYVKLRSMIRKNHYNAPEDTTPLTPHFLGATVETSSNSNNNNNNNNNNNDADDNDDNDNDNDDEKTTTVSHAFDINSKMNDEYSIQEISKILGCKIKSNTSNKEKRKLISDILTLKECETVIQENFHHIQECFRFYSSSDSKTASLNFDETKLMLKDVRLYDNVVINDKAIVKAFKLSDMSVSKFLQKFPIDGLDTNINGAESSQNNDNNNTLNIPPKLQPLGRQKPQSVQQQQPSTAIGAFTASDDDLSIDSTDDLSQNNEPAAKKALNKANPNLALTIFEFLEFLLRIAYRKFQTKNASLADKLRFLLIDYIARHSASGDQLRDQIQSKSIQKVLKSPLEAQLQEAFKYYGSAVASSSANDSNNQTSGKQTGKQSSKQPKKSKSKSNGNDNYINEKDDKSDENSKEPKITFDQFCGMLDELQLISSNFTRATFKTIFKRAMFTNEKSSHFRAINSKSKSGKYVETLDYDAFVECLVVIALYKKPDPYLPLSTRVEEFLVSSVINPLYHKSKISKGASLMSESD